MAVIDIEEEEKEHKKGVNHAIPFDAKHCCGWTYGRRQVESRRCESLTGRFKGYDWIPKGRTEKTSESST